MGYSKLDSGAELATTWKYTIMLMGDSEIALLGIFTKVETNSVEVCREGSTFV